MDEKLELGEEKSIAKSIVVGAVGLLSGVYLLNPGFGAAFEIPDIIPIFGNLDEAAAATLLISCLAYFGLDITRIFGKAKQFSDKEEEDSSEKTVTGDVVG